MDFMGSPPFIRTPLTNMYHILGGLTLQNSSYKQCAKFEAQYMDCLEANGFDKGVTLCRDFFEDLYECRYGYKEAWRIEKIKEQRKKLYQEGKIKDRYYSLPEMDTFYPKQ